MNPIRRTPRRKRDRFILGLTLMGLFFMATTSCKAGENTAIKASSAESNRALDIATSNSDIKTGSSSDERMSDEQSGDKQADFVSVLKSYQDLNTRLENIAAPLLLSNTALCPKVRQDPGFTVHTLLDYPENLQAVARELLPVSETLSIRTIRKGGPAAKAGLKVGDVLRQVESYDIPFGPTARQFYGWVAQKTYSKDYVELSIIRDNIFMDAQIIPQTMCDYPVSIFFSPEINGHSDGEAVWITSGLMRSQKSDNNLALIVAHELAHNISDKTQFKSNKARELMADRMALVLMQRAGFDIDDVLIEWDAGQHPHSDQQKMSKTHPTLDERYKNFEVESARIKRQINAGQIPTF